MSSLTVALAALGGLVLAGIVAHGAWTARRADPKRGLPAGRPVEFREPVLGDAGEAGADARDTADTTAFSLERKLPKRMPARIDALIDAIAVLNVDAPISGELLLAHLPPTRRAGSKPFLIEGLNADTGEWEPPQTRRHYSEVQAGVQLANRGGALNEIEYSEFVQAIQPLAEAVGAMADFPDMLEVAARARELDTFASQHDAQLAVHLNARSSPWSVAYIQQHAGRHGFVPGMVPGRLVLPSMEEGAPPVLTLGFDSLKALDEHPQRATVSDVTLSFDVPQTDAKAEPFITWQASATALSLGMDAAVVDDNGQPISPQGFGVIGAELTQLYAALDARDLAAGSMAARRLFS
ncbi:MAG: cell division protein FtsZ [Methylibium sp. NZG]|nr:MAG: cell division protein FtsZ [Methylibium sp. NZG]